MYRCRYIVSEPASGAMNMALDEALLESAAEDGCTAATLRIYRWARPTLSLGYFQRAADREGHADSRDCDLVRRPSGGGAIVHDRELTYALVLPSEIVQGETASGWYFRVHEALIAAIRELTGATATLCENPPKLSAAEEPFLCFERRAAGDVLLKTDRGEQKIAGSAQRRRRGAILQHGSMLLTRSPHAPQLPGLDDLVDADLTYAALAESFSTSIAQRLRVILQTSEITVGERELARLLADEKFSNSQWSLRR